MMPNRTKKEGGGAKHKGANGGGNVGEGCCSTTLSILI
jgi:hypothetical protein